MDSCLLSFQKNFSLNTSFDDLPDGLVDNILSRLPIKTLIQSTCISKKWYFTIKSPSFISIHLSHSKSDPSNYYIFLIHSLSSKVNVFFDNHLLTRHPDFNLPFETRSASLKPIGSCNGLICLTDHSEKYQGRDIFLINPFINKYRKLAVESSSYVDLIGEINDKNVAIINVGFGYSEVENDHKVVRIIILQNDNPRYDLFKPKVEIYSIKRGIWKPVDVSFKIAMPASYEIPVFAHGCLYWKIDGLDENDQYLLCFDLKDEVFSNKIKFPPTYHKHNGSWDCCIVAKDDSVAVILHTMGRGSSMKICLLKLEKNNDGEYYWKKINYVCNEFSIKKCLGFSNRGRLIMNWGFPEKYLVAIDLDKSCAMEKVSMNNRNFDDYFYGATNVVESLVLFSD